MIGIFCIIITIIAFMAYPELFFITLVVGVVFAAIYMKLQNDENLKKQEDERKIKSSPEYSQCMEEYKRLVSEYKGSGFYLEYEDDDDIWDKGRHYAILDNNLHILEVLDEDSMIEIVKSEGEIPQEVYDIDKIKYYTVEGSVYQQQHISGGGGGGSSVTGAVVGGLVAGDAGAIIGSHKKINDVQTTYEKVDDRHVVVTFVDNSHLNLPYEFYDRLLDYIPEKDYENYLAAKRAKGKRNR